MCIVNSKKNKNVYAKRGNKVNHIKCTVKTREEKRNNKQVQHTEVNPTLAIITLNMNIALSIQIKKLRLSK